MSIAKKFIAKSGAELEYVSLIDVYNNGTLISKGRAHKLFKKVYNGIYQEAFPLPDERELFCDWVRLVETGGKELITFGKDLESDNPIIMGFVSSAVLGDSCCGMVDYRIRDKKYKQILSGAEISAKSEEAILAMNYNLNRKPLKMIVGEINNPEKLNWNENDPNRFTIDCMNPQKRVDHFTSKMGYKKIGIDYVQVPLRKDKNVCKSLLLMQHSPERYPDATAEDLEKLIINYYQITTGDNNPYNFNDRDLNRMMNQIKIMKTYNIPIHAEKQSSYQKQLIQTADHVFPSYLIGGSQKARGKLIRMENINWQKMELAKSFG